MDLKNKTLSLHFYNYLCDIIGSEEVVRTRREIFTAKDIVQNTSFGTFISSGSKAEGIDLVGSDYDQMILPNIFRVYENLHDVQSDRYEILLFMDTNDTKTGYTRLKLHTKLSLDTGMIADLFETIGDEKYISSKRFREQLLPHDMVIHGPCQSSTRGGFDYAISARCNEWITPAQQWIYRSRTTWPDYTLVTSAVQEGVLFVPIGCKNSPNEDLQWRISFSKTEKLLIHSFCHTQLLCYALMKIILKDLIKPQHGDLLCSYFLKTIMFWLSEEMNQSKWKPENMISCFLDCMRRLIYCVEYKTCLHYFIPENNLFEDRFTDNQHKALLVTLRVIYESPLTSVFEASTLQHYKLESFKSHDMVLSASELSCYIYMSMTMLTHFSESMYNIIRYLVNVWVNRELSTYTLSIYAKEVIQSFRLCNMMAKNKEYYQQYNISLCFFKMSLRSFSISSWLLLASLFYKCKRFQECLDIINYSLSRCTPNMVFLNFTNNLVEQTVFKKMKHRCGSLLAIKHLVIEYVAFRYPFCLLPDHLIPLIVNATVLIPPVVYAYLLQFLCCHHLGDYSGKQNALHDLELTIRERYFIVNSTQTLREVHASLNIVKSLL